MGRLDGKVALVTGGAQGMGESHVRHLIAEGARLVFGDVRDEQGQTLADSLGPGCARYVHHDVTNEADWQRVVEITTSTFGRLDVLVNNAGILRRGTIEKMPLAEFRQVMDTNLVGSWLGIKYVTAAMKSAGGGSIVNISSVEGFAGTAGLSAYSASKFAVRGITRSAAQELGRYGIRVNSVHPGGILTPLLREEAAAFASDTDGAAKVFGRMPIPRLGEPLEVSRLVAFLASDDSSYCTGSEFVVDGGMISGPGY
ncbi:MAG TPA: glucose 1-dehydrogenase [Kineosporiaceae bacterium]